MSRTCLALLLSIVAGLSAAHAAEQRISAQKLILRRSSSGKETLRFVSKDPAFLFPALGSSDDPSTAGALVELFAPFFPVGIELAAPAGVGNPGWSSRTGATPLVQFKNGNAPDAPSSFRSVQFRMGKTIKLNGKKTGLILDFPLTAVGIRITTGSLVNCARFTIANVTKSTPGTFIARNAVASAINNCSNEALGGQPITTTTDGSLPPSTTTSTSTTLPGTCGDGTVNQSSEQCDGADDAFCEGVLACGPPGYSTGCQCCIADTGPTFNVPDIPCCDPQASEVFFPSIKQCVSTRCSAAFDCDLGSCQSDGSCCAPLGGACSLQGGGGSFAAVSCCDPAAVCNFAFPSGACCYPAGIGCSVNQQCCSGTCDGGACAP